MSLWPNNVVEGHNMPSNKHIFDQYSALVANLYVLESIGSPIFFSNEAEVVRQRIERRVVELNGVETLPQGLKTHIGKFEGMFARYCLLFHVVDLYERRVHPNSENVSGAVAERVEHFMMTYLMSHAMSFYRDVIGKNDTSELAKWIARFILAKERAQLTRRDLKRLVAQAKNSTDWELHNAMEALATLGWVEPNDNQRPHAKWQVNPKVHSEFQEKSAIEKERRAREYKNLQEIFSQMKSVEEED